VVEPQFVRAQGFSEGLAAVTVLDKSNNEISWYIDKSGRRAFPGNFDPASSFVMGRAHVRIGRSYYDSRWSYIDSAGRAVFTYTDQGVVESPPNRD
jgi:hypothetical protein